MDLLRTQLTKKLDRASRVLRRGNRSDRHIHETRRLLKRGRALLRLLRKSLGEDGYRRENARLRDAGRPLAAVRDAAVLVRALDGLCPRSSDTTAFCRHLRAALRLESSERNEQLHRKALLSSAHAIRGVARRIRAPPRPRVTAADLAKAVKRAYRASRRAMTAAAEQDTRARLHEWRKHVKYFANELESLSPVMRKGMGKTCRKSHRLADYLGDDHDLALLHDKIIEYRRSTGASVDALVRRLAQRRTELQRKAHRHGRRLFRDSARRLEARVRRRLRGPMVWNLSKERIRVLNQAKVELRKALGRPPD
jgi:CHAD domain-containing protein